MQRKPPWLKVKLPSGENFNNLSRIIKNNNLHTICTEAKCPNIAECFSKRTATFLILGDICTRNCLYCNVKHGIPTKADEQEPKKIAEAIKKLNLRYAVITSVTRDDLPDGGAGVFFKTVSEIRKIERVMVELLIPDLRGKLTSLKNIIKANPDVLGHNIEVAMPLFPKLRPQGSYFLSLNLLNNIKRINKKQRTKSGIMIGLSESRTDIIRTMQDLRNSNVDFLTIGQYLQPRKDLAEVKKFYTPEEFSELKKIGMKMGFMHVESGPLVRSSYHADEIAKLKT